MSSALLAPAIAPSTPAWARLTMLAAIVLIDFVYFQVLARTFSRPAVQRFYASARKTIERAVGCVLIAFGGGLNWKLSQSSEASFFAVLTGSALNICVEGSRRASGIVACI